MKKTSLFLLLILSGITHFSSYCMEDDGSADDRRSSQASADAHKQLISTVERNQIQQLSPKTIIDGMQDKRTPHDTKAKLANYVLVSHCFDFPKDFLLECGIPIEAITVIRMSGVIKGDSQNAIKATLALQLLQDTSFRDCSASYIEGKFVHSENSIIPNVVPLVIDKKILPGIRRSLFNVLCGIPVFSHVIFPRIFAALMIDTDFDLKDYRQPIAEVFFKLRDDIDLQLYKEHFLTFFREVSHDTAYVHTFLPKLSANIHFSTIEELSDLLPCIRAKELPIEVRSLSLSMILANNPLFSKALSAEVLMMLNDLSLTNKSKTFLAGRFLKHSGSEVQASLPLFLNLFEDHTIEANNISPKLNSLKGKTTASATRLCIANGLLTNTSINIQDHFSVFEHFIKNTKNEYPLRLYIAIWLIVHNHYKLTVENLPLFTQFVFQPKLARVEAFLLEKLCTHSNESIAESIRQEINARSIEMPLECAKLEDVIDIYTPQPCKLSSELFNLEFE
jgi:hypothetical protein